MKPILFILLFSLPFVCPAQPQTNIPLIDGKIVFTDTLPDIRDWQLFKSGLISGLNESMQECKEFILQDDTIYRQIVCRITDYLEMEKNNRSVFALYMKYTLLIQHQDDKCIVSLFNIRYIEYEDMQKSPGNPHSFPAEYVLIEKKYKPAFVKNAIQKISDKTNIKVNEIFAGIHAQKFTHPGILHTAQKMDLIRYMIAQKVEPAYGSFLLLKEHPFAQTDYKMQGPFRVFFANRKKYIEAGMENEKFYGWGIEDGERYVRWSKLNYKIKQVEGVLFHLNHPRGLNSFPQHPDQQLIKMREHIFSSHI